MYLYTWQLRCNITCSSYIFSQLLESLAIHFMQDSKENETKAVEECAGLTMDTICFYPSPTITRDYWTGKQRNGSTDNGRGCRKPTEISDEFKNWKYVENEKIAIEWMHRITQMRRRRGETSSWNFP